AAGALFDRERVSARGARDRAWLCRESDRAHPQGRLRLPQAMEAVACTESARTEGQKSQEKIQKQVKKGKRDKGIGMEGRIATWYARNTANDVAEFRALADRMANAIQSGSRILEVAPGPGYLSIELARRGQYAITGLDISKTFVEIATANARRASVNI